ncbi:uncharacterized protein BXZ73DRAFT_101200 [Epithele typhae]|uniref:uncharacterized protein n=1 Tax=Epithele typhae TaxID=378194 RepID=UPI002007C292|nr:uncharacterized protein BXZ73DRAFT_101200 [Epithele typhae]KAH9933241.1 hypothetical protein BXZ73DRAFT_101200 [Epithele typhae]
MVRRRSGKSKATQSKARPVDRRESKMKKWNKAADIPLDEEDQFHSSRDRILLEGDDDGGSDDGDDDEVFALKGMPEDDSDSDEGDAEMRITARSLPRGEKEKKKKAKAKAKGKDVSSSSEGEEEDSSEEEGWGMKKAAYYASNAEQIESDDEEANELEEQEARRLQGRARDAMGEDDFGIADDLVEPVAPTLPQDKQALLRHLEKTTPETLALAHDWEDVAHAIMRSQTKIDKLEAEDPNTLSLSMLHLHYQALLTYGTTLAFYLHLRASPKYVARPDLLAAHPILPRLLTLKQSLHTLEDLDFAASDASSLASDFDLSDGDFSDADSGAEEYGTEMDWRADAQNLWAGDGTRRRKGKGLDLGELEGLLADANEVLDALADEDGAGAEVRPKRKAAIKASANTNASAAEPPKKKRKAVAGKAAAPVFDLVEPEFPAASSSSAGASSTKKAKKKPKPPADGEGDADVYGEAGALDAADAADKSARRRTLRFHVSRIEGSAAKRAGARAAARGGDDDIPYRERRKEREARLAKEVANAREKARGDELDDADPEAEADGAKGDTGKSEGDEYYDLVRRTFKAAKEKKKAEHDAAVVAEAKALGGDEEPRTNAIADNQAVRNPRVKKRRKYEQAQRKVASQRAVYRGGVDVTRYAGEKTGISTAAKGVRFDRS